MKNLVLFLLAIFLTTAAMGQINIPIGQEFSVETHNLNNLNVKNRDNKREDDLTFSFKMVGITNEYYKLSCTMTRAKIKEYWPDGLVFNSDSIRQTSMHSSGIIMPLIFLEKPFTVILTPNGKVLKTEGVDALIQQAINKWHLEDGVVEYLKQHAPQFILSAISNVFFDSPGQKIGYQSSWTNAATNTTYTVTAIAGALLTLTASAGDTLKAKYTLNQVNGLPEMASISFKKKDDDYTISNDYSHNVSYNKHDVAGVDTAWANMALTISLWNQSIRPDYYHLDSATVFNYFKIYDVQYTDDAYYNTQKIQLIHGVDNLEKDLYKNLLLKTSNKLLSEIDLINKMHYIMDTDIDQIYDFVKFRFKTEAFNSWFTGLDGRLTGAPADERQIKYIISQGYSREMAMEIAKVQDRNLANSYLLLERMNNDPDPKIRQKADAMYLWINAFKNNKDVVYLRKTARQFNKLNNAQMKSGNGIRYGVALCGLLRQRGANVEADAVLKKVIKYGERYLADTAQIAETYVQRDAKRSINEVLMTAYYLKYQQSKPTDSVKALTYLAKAAMHSPSNFDEQSNRLNGNQAIFWANGIRVKESYRREYIEALFAGGDYDKAMNLLAANAATDLGSLPEMQRIYKQRYPDKNFDEFVKEKIIANWIDAPSFTAQDINGKSYKLSDYRGKWLVLDFWGTWCPPCRAEMPEVEKFNQEINAGKHQGIVMLGIASDSEKMLSRYLKDNKPLLTSVMINVSFSDYKINTIPTKCLIAPNGKMVKLPRDAEWQEVVEKLNELYAAN